MSQHWHILLIQDLCSLHAQYHAHCARHTHNLSPVGGYDLPYSFAPNAYPPYTISSHRLTSHLLDFLSLSWSHVPTTQHHSSTNRHKCVISHNSTPPLHPLFFKSSRRVLFITLSRSPFICKPFSSTITITMSKSICL